MRDFSKVQTTTLMYEYKKIGLFSGEENSLSYLLFIIIFFPNFLWPSYGHSKLLDESLKVNYKIDEPEAFELIEKIYSR